jgi:hypothetical protein
MRSAMFDRRPASDDAVPKEIARALDASAEDLRHDRTEDLRDFVKRMEAELEAHLAQRNSKKL